KVLHVFSPSSNVCVAGLNPNNISSTSGEQSGHVAECPLFPAASVTEKPCHPSGMPGDGACARQLWQTLSIFSFQLSTSHLFLRVERSVLCTIPAALLALHPHPDRRDFLLDPYAVLSHVRMLRRSRPAIAQTNPRESHQGRE